MKLLHYIGLFATAAAKRNAWIYVMDGNLASATAVENYFLDMARAGATHLMSSFLVPGQAGFPATGEADTVAVWRRLSPSDQSSIVQKLHNEGTQLYIVSAGGNYGTLYLQYDPSTWAQIVCGHAADNHYDGVDMDLENFGPQQATQFVSWAIDATTACRTYVNHISHAPQSPYFHSGWNNAYDQLVDYVDTLLVQFYNQGAAAHADYHSTFIKDTNWPTWSDLAARHPEAKDKFVVGKFIYPDHGGSGRFTPSQFAEAAKKAEAELGYNGGIMLWRAPQPTEPQYKQFITTDLPMLSDLGTDTPITPRPPQTPAPVPSKPQATRSHNAVTTIGYTRPPVATPMPPHTPPPATAPGASGGDAVVECQATLDSPNNAVWAEDCRAKCAWYAEQALFCPEGVSTASSLMACVKRLHPYCV